MKTAKHLYFFLLFDLSIFFITNYLYSQDTFKENLNFSSLKKQKQQDIVGGLIDKSDLKVSFFNNGRFCPPEEFIPELPSALFDKYGYLRFLDLWIGIPSGPWTPLIWGPDSQKYVSIGPTVSGTIYEPFISGTDWSTIVGTKGVFYSGELLYSNVYPPSINFDFVLAANSEHDRTWPRNPLTGLRQWPGRWRTDPITNEPIDGVFLGDQDIFISFDDKILADQIYPEEEYLNRKGQKFLPQRGYSIGTEVLAQVIGFGEAYASNIIIFDLKIINTSSWDYHDVFLGVYYYAGNPFYEQNKFYTEWYHEEKTGFIKNEFDSNLNQVIPYNLSYSYHHDSNYNLSWITPFRGEAKYLGVQILKTPQAINDFIDNDGDGLIDELEGEELGLTGWHFLLENNILIFGRRERLQYQMLSGDTTGLSSLIRAQSCFFSKPDELLDPNFDSPEAIKMSYAHRGGIIEYVSNLLSCGPVDWSSEDTLDFVFAVLVADSLDKLKGSAQLAHKIVTNQYQRSDAPPPPKVTAVPQDGKAILYWDSSTETAKDFITGYRDFEGYKIYRTTSDPINNNWGEQILDHDGKIINYIPIARCDLNNGICGYEKVYPFQKLGDDTGLFHLWIDSTVTNGVTYWYSVCSYDHGIVDDEESNPARFPLSPIKECSKGTDPERDINLVRVIPGSQATDYTTPTITVKKLAESAGNGQIEAIIVNPYQITGHDYLMLFEDTTFGFAAYNLVDETENKFLFEKVWQTKGEEGIIFDGIQLKVKRYDDMTVLNEQTYWYKYNTGELSNCTWSIYGGKLTWDPYPYEYDIIFTDKMDTSVFMKRTAPFEIWNTVLNRKVLWDIYFNFAGTDTTDSLINTWSSGDMIYIWDEFNEKNKFTLRIIINERSIHTYQGLQNIPPQPGDAAHIALKRPFRTGDQFRISTKTMQKRELKLSELNQIKVVPNPYLVKAGWELSRNESKIQFINLPSECQIHIYTIAGDKVRTLSHHDSNANYEFWDLLNNSNLKVSYGLYIFIVETPNGRVTRGKFVILK